MVSIDIDVDGVKTNLYIDDGLYKGIEEKIKPKISKKDEDWVGVVDGGEGYGKSVFAMQLAKVLDPSFNLDRVCMTPDEFTKVIINAQKGQCVVYDEAFTGLSSRSSLTEINRLLVALMMEMRQKNLFVIIVMPTFFMLDRYVALFRARCLFHVFKSRGRKGFWVYFNSRKKKFLYLVGKKYFSYKTPRSSMRGRFFNRYTVNEQKYREKKSQALIKKRRVTKRQVYMVQRDVLIYTLYKKFGQSQMNIERIFKEFGLKLIQNSISRVIKRFQKKFDEGKLTDLDVADLDELDSEQDEDEETEDK